MATPGMLFNDGYPHQFTVYLLNGRDLPSTGGANSFTNTEFSVIQNPHSDLRVPISTPSNNTVTIACNIRKPVYVWVHKKGNIRSYPFIPSTINGKSTLHVANKQQYSAGNTNENSGVIVDINGREFVINTNGVQLCSVENPDYENIDGWSNVLRIRIKNYRSQLPIPVSSFGIGIAFYEQHNNPARDPDKYIVH